MFIVVTDDGEVSPVSFPPFRQLIHGLRAKPNQTTETRHVFSRRVMDVSADFSLHNEIVGGIRTNERDALVSQRLVVSANILNGHRGARCSENIFLFKTVF